MARVEMDSRGLDRLLRELPRESDQVVRKAAFDIEAKAKQKAPVDTGFLRNSIAMVDTDAGDGQAEVVVGADYGTYVEFGTSSREAQPYMTPAVEAVRPQFEKGLAALVKRLGNGGPS